MNTAKEFPLITELPEYGVTTSEGGQVLSPEDALLREIDDALESRFETPNGVMCSVVGVRNRMKAMGQAEVSTLSGKNKVSQSVMEEVRSAFILRLQKAKPR